MRIGFNKQLCFCFAGVTTLLILGNDGPLNANHSKTTKNNCTLKGKDIRFAVEQARVAKSKTFPEQCSKIEIEVKESIYETKEPATMKTLHVSFKKPFFNRIFKKDEKKLECDLIIPLFIPKNCSLKLYKVSATGYSFLREQHDAEFAFAVAEARKLDKGLWHSGLDPHKKSAELSVTSQYHKGRGPFLIAPCNRKNSRFDIGVRLRPELWKNGTPVEHSGHSTVGFDSVYITLKESDDWPVETCPSGG